MKNTSIFSLFEEVKEEFKRLEDDIKQKIDNIYEWVIINFSNNFLFDFLNLWISFFYFIFSLLILIIDAKSYHYL